MGWKFYTSAALTWAILSGFLKFADDRADYWQPVFEGIAKRSDYRLVGRVHVVPLKGCGWSLGETVTGKLDMQGVSSDFTMCRSRHGVRFDLTTHESRWIRRAA